ncbi:MAG: hypothetical protein M3R38_29315, partial [Actinomycetota bacterium]|nr:hypothetical protein [Actinomycetota bacterium]
RGSPPNTPTEAPSLSRLLRMGAGLLRVPALLRPPRWAFWARPAARIGVGEGGIGGSERSWGPLRRTYGATPREALQRPQGRR